MIGPAVGADGAVAHQRVTEAAARIPTVARGPKQGVPDAKSVKRYIDQSIIDFWWIKKKQVFSMNSTWINSNISL